MALEPATKSEEVDYSFKIVLLGDPAVGKTSLVKRCVDNMFTLDYIMTIGMDIRSKNVRIDDKEIKLVIWDLAGQKIFQDVREVYCKGSNGAILVFDLTRQATLMSLHGWIQMLWRFVGKLPLAIVGNKADLRNIREIPRERALDFVRLSGAKYFETSAKTGESVAKTFHYIAETVLKDL